MRIVTMVCILLGIGILPALAASPAPRAAGVDSLAPLPNWTEPSEYRQELHITQNGETHVITRYRSKSGLRTEMQAQGQTAVILEPAGDTKTVFVLIPAEKMALQDTPSAEPPARDSTEQETAGPSAHRSPRNPIHRTTARNSGSAP